MQLLKMFVHFYCRQKTGPSLRGQGILSLLQGFQEVHVDFVQEEVVLEANDQRCHLL